MAGDARTSGDERALMPPVEGSPAALTWSCPRCGYATPGTVDQPFVGDGTCPAHERQLLRLAVPPQNT
jgi:hypothetical protein